MNTKEIIEKIAKERNLSPDVVEDEMREAIRQAMSSKDPKAKMLWQQLAPDGKEPSVEEFLSFCVEMVKKKNNRYQ